MTQELVPVGRYRKSPCHAGESLGYSTVVGVLRRVQKFDRQLVGFVDQKKKHLGKIGDGGI